MTAKRTEALVERIGLRIREQLAELRRKRGFSQRELAERIGVSQPVVAKLESGGQGNLELRTLARVAEALSADLRLELVERETAPARPKSRAA